MGLQIQVLKASIRSEIEAAFATLVPDRAGLAKGRLIAFDDGSIDPFLVGTPWRQGADQGADQGAEAASAAPHVKLTYAEAGTVLVIPRQLS